MALPSLDNKTSIGNLSLDDKASIISSLVRSDKLQLANYGAINFNQNVTVTGTATREGGEGFNGNVVISILTELKNSILGLSSDIKNFISSSETEKQVSQNFMEAVAKDIKSKGEEENSGGARGFNEATFKTFSVMTDYLKEIRDSMETLADKLGTGGIGGILGGVGGAGLSGTFANIFKSLLSRLGKGLGLLGRSIPVLAAGYVLSQIPWGNLAEKGKELISGEGDITDRISSLFSGDFREDGEEGETTTADSGSAQPQTPTSPQTNNTGTTIREPAGTSAGTTGMGTQRTATERRFDSRTDPSIASESDLSGLIFANHSGKGMPIKLEKQILKALAQRLQYIRKKLGGKTLTINSGYRTPEYNKTVGGAKNSQHKQRKAADVSKKGLNLNDQKIFVRSAVEAGIGGIGFYDNFIHIDIRNRSNGYISRWGKIPGWALEFINHPEKYSMDDSTVSEAKTVSEDHMETGEEGDSTVTSEQKDAGSAERTTPTSSGGNKKPKETAIPESGTTETPEEEEEQEEVGETALKESTSTNTAKKETAIKQGGLFPENIEKLFKETEEKHKLPKGLLKAIAKAETGENTKFETRLHMGSSKGALGLMQFMPQTANAPYVKLKDRTDPVASIKAAGRYLDHIRSVIKSDDPILLAAAYNAGEYHKSFKEGKVPNLTETKGYVKKVASFMNAPQSESYLADRGTTIPDNKPKGENELSETGTASTETPQEPTTADSTKPEKQSVGEKIAESFKTTLEDIKGITDFKQADMSFAVGKYMEEVGSSLGFDPKRLNLPKNKPAMSSLEMEKTEEAKKIQLAQAEIEQAKQQKTADVNKQTTQQPVVNVVNQGGGQRSESQANAGAPNQLAVRNQNPVVMEQQYATHTRRTVP